MNAAPSGLGLPARQLLGRQREREVLDRLLEAARDGNGGVLVVHGEPGVVKSALLDYAVEAGPEFRVARTAGVEAEMELPFAAVHQLCSPSLEHMERLPAPQRDALAVAFGLSAGSAPSPFWSDWRSLACSPTPPRSSRCCVPSMTRSGSIWRRPGCLRSSPAVCWRRGSRSCSRRASWATPLRACRSSMSSRWGVAMRGHY